MFFTKSSFGESKLFRINKNFSGSNDNLSFSRCGENNCVAAPYTGTSHMNHSLFKFLYGMATKPKPELNIKDDPVYPGIYCFHTSAKKVHQFYGFELAAR